MARELTANFAQQKQPQNGFPEAKFEKLKKDIDNAIEYNIGRGFYYIYYVLDTSWWERKIGDCNGIILEKLQEYIDNGFIVEWHNINTLYISWER